MEIKDMFGPYLQYLKDKGYAQATYTNDKILIEGSLSHSIQNKTIDALCLADAALVEKAGRQHGEYGAQRSVVVFRKFLKFLKARGVQMSFDWRDIEIPKVPQKPVEYLTEQEVGQIRQAFDLEKMTGLRGRTIFELTYSTGLRSAELCSLNKEDIRWEAKEITVTNCKTKQRGQIVFLTDEAIYWLKRYLATRQDGDLALFVSERKQRLSAITLRFGFRHQLKTDINKHICNTLFRRTLITQLIHKKVDIKAVQTIARHKSERTTLRHYTGVDMEKVKAQHQAAMNT